MRVTSAARTLIDLAPQLTPTQRDKAVREAIRLRCCSALTLRLVCARHRGRRGVTGLAALAARLEGLPLARTRSDAEARALQVLAAAGKAGHELNRRVAGEEADLYWPATRRILEIDGPQYHRDPTEDARKEGIWRTAGWEVHRIPSNLPFDEPERLVALATERERPPTAA